VNPHAAPRETPGGDGPRRHDGTEADVEHRRQRLSVGDAPLGKTRLLSRQCQTCILRPGNPMHLEPGRLRQFLAEAQANGGYVICHSTLPHYRYPNVQPAICRGFADRYRTLTLTVMERLWGFVEVDPPGEHEYTDDAPQPAVTPTKTPMTPPA
jgi:hypothetical protein